MVQCSCLLRQPAQRVGSCLAASRGETRPLARSDLIRVTRRCSPCTGLNKRAYPGYGLESSLRDEFEGLIEAAAQRG
jgi:hypothetical protein